MVVAGRVCGVASGWSFADGAGVSVWGFGSDGGVTTDPIVVGGGGTAVDCAVGAAFVAGETRVGSGSLVTFSRSIGVSGLGVGLTTLVAGSVVSAVWAQAVMTMRASAVRTTVAGRHLLFWVFELSLLMSTESALLLRHFRSFGLWVYFR